MEHYVGLDVSLKHTAICVVDQTGKIVCEGVVVSDPEAIEMFVKSKAPFVDWGQALCPALDALLKWAALREEMAASSA
jgi:hypothetical protein